MEKQTALPALMFEQKPIRQIQLDGETYFSIVDIIALLSDAAQPRTYWAKLKKKMTEEEGQLLPNWKQLKLKSDDGKMYATDCANTEGVLRIIQSVPSPKAEPFKMWLAGLGKQAIEEAADPELTYERMMELYKSKGYSDEWIKNRVQGIETRRQLTDEWQKRGVKEGQEYAVLTASIAKGTFGLTPTEHKQLKGVEKENLRDHMTELELIFTALGEAASRIYSEDSDAQGFEENHDAALKGGNAAGNARRTFEKDTKREVVSAKNFLKKEESKPNDKLEAPPQ